MLARDYNRHFTYYDDEPFEFLPFHSFYKKQLDIVHPTRIISTAVQIAGTPVTIYALFHLIIM